jgi:hypothetical protein
LRQFKVLRHTPDKFDQFLEDNFLSGRAISMIDTLHEDNCDHCACFKIFTFLSYHLIFKLFSENEKSSFFWKSPKCINYEAKEKLLAKAVEFSFIYQHKDKSI